MASKTDGNANGCTFLWKIENISHCCLKKGEVIPGPCFIAEALEGTKWSLIVYPMGLADENYIDCDLHRNLDSRGPIAIEVNWQLALLDKDGSCLKKEKKMQFSFKRGDFSPYLRRIDRKKVFITDREAFLPEDTLTIQCTIWKKDEDPIITKYLSVQTVFKVNRRSFVWGIYEFSTLDQPPLINRFKDDLIDIELVLTENLDHVRKLELDIISFNEDLKYFSFKISFINLEGEKEECGVLEYMEDDLTKGVLPIPLFSKLLMENKLRYLQNDVLLLDCEYIYTNGKMLQEFINGRIYSPKELKMVVKKQTPQQMSVLATDLKSMYNDGIFSDIEIRTLTKTFPTHKNILSARSPVFRRMFSNDMKEKNSGQVYITDLEDDTVQRMLFYIYTDTLPEDLQLGNACKLYEAADKYQILSLRSTCSSFLKESICPTKVCEVLILADLHQDVDLKSVVQDYILEHNKEVFGSQEWKDFMDTNSKLALEIMYRKVFNG